MKRIVFYLLMGTTLLLFSCEEEKEPYVAPVVEQNPTPEIDPFDGPDYPDNYLQFASWGYRAQWNLGNVHDPSVAKSGDYFYMYQTDASYGNAHDGHGHFPYRRSKNLVDWEFLGAAFTEAPAWVKDSLNNKRERDSLPAIANPNYGFWAPSIRKVNDNLYRFYYSIVVTNPIDASLPKSWSERAFIGLAESTDLASNKWVDKGMVVCSEPDGKASVARSSDGDWNAYFQFNAIDPSYIVTPEGEHWLIYGSWHSGIAAVQLDPETGLPFQLEKLEDYGTRIAGRGNIANNRWQAMEGPEIIYNEETGYYYLFVAYDELSVAYNTRVARSTSITGPYYGINGGNVTEGAECFPVITHPYKFSDDNHGGWVGFSHCAVFQDDDGQWFYSSQARFPVDLPGVNASNALMLGHVRKIEWTSDGWPVVSPERFAGVPQTELADSLIVGSYEIVTLGYNYQTIQIPDKTLIIGSNGKAGGSYSGDWTFDANAGILRVGNQEFIVRKGYNWESSPRKSTLVISGINGQGFSLWGKKTF